MSPGLGRAIAYFSVFIALPGQITVAFNGDFTIAVFWALAANLVAGVAIGAQLQATRSGNRTRGLRTAAVDAGFVLSVQLVMGYLCLIVGAITATYPGPSAWVSPLRIAAYGVGALVIGAGIGLLVTLPFVTRRRRDDIRSRRGALTTFIVAAAVLVVCLVVVWIAGSLAFYDLNTTAYGTRLVYQLIVVLTGISSDSVGILNSWAPWAARAALAIAILCIIVAAHSAHGRWGSARAAKPAS